MTTSPEHVKGIVITVAGVLVLSPDAVIVRLIAADPWTLLVWRNLMMTTGLMAWLAIRYRRGLGQRLRAIGFHGLLAAILFAASSIFFISALARTTVADTLIIIAVSPLIGAVFSLVFLGERVARRTWMALPSALIGVAIILYPAWQNGAMEANRLAGDLCALGTALSIAGYFTVVRAARKIDMVPALALSGPIAAAAAALAAPAFMVDGRDFLLLAVLGLILMPIAFALISAGPRYLPAPEIGLLLLLETALGPLWAWLVLGEQPGSYAVAGGAVVMVTLAVHAAAGLASARSPIPLPADSGE